MEYEIRRIFTEFRQYLGPDVQHGWLEIAVLSCDTNDGAGLRQGSGLRKERGLLVNQ
jgi:hypothetical protein